MNILVTGGAGFIGSHVVNALEQRGDTVVIIDNFNDYYNPLYKRDNINSFGTTAIYEMDICDLKKLTEVFQQHQLDCIIHLAARAGIRPSILQPELYRDVNIIGTNNLAELAVRYHVPQFIFGSSSSVYGNSNHTPYVETDTSGEPISPYAATKLAAETLLSVLAKQAGINVTCLRFFTVYGERGRPDMAPYLFTEAILRGTPIKKFGDGTTSRDYTYVADIVQGIITAIQHPFKYEIINLGNHATVTLNEFISTVEQLTSKHAILEQLPLQPGDMPHTCADITKAQRLLQYQPRTNFAQGMAKFIRWFTMNRL